MIWDLQVRAIKDSQRDEPDFGPLRQWLIDGTEPAEGVLFLANRATKYYWVNRDIFRWDREIIWRENPKTTSRQLLVSTPLREEILYLNHDVPMSGHQGMERTAKRIKAKYYWHGMTHDIEAYVKACPQCSQWKRPTRRARWEMSQFHAGIPMERVHLDFLGPLPKTSRGNEYILMGVDQFTKWVECIPLPSQTAEVTAQAVVSQFFSRFGIPLQLHTDRGSNFESKLFDSICKLLQIHKSRTTAYRPSANGQVERFNRTLMDAVRCFVGKHQKSWDIFVPQIASALRSSVNRSTGFTPNRLMLGREVVTPADLVLPVRSSDIPEADAEGYVLQLERSLKLSHEVARETLKSNQATMKRDYDLKIHRRSYSVGDVVYVLNTASKKGSAKKLSIQWNGPGVVVKKLTPYLYEVRLKKVTTVINHDRMKACSVSDLPGWVSRVVDSLKAEAGYSVPVPSAEEFCICRKPDDGGFMIQCDFCREWYHGHCVNLTECDAELIDTYTCTQCELGPRVQQGSTTCPLTPLQ